MRILSLEYDLSFQRDLAAELEAAGNEVVLVSKVADALAQDAKEPFDLVITETRLLDGDGLDFLRELKKARGARRPNVIFFTASDDDDLRARCAAEGARRFLVKGDGWPANLADIHGVMAELEPEDVRAAAARLPSRSDTRVFKGNLETIEMLDIVQLLNLGRKTGTLILSGGVLEGRIFFEDGEVVEARSDELTGPEGLSALLGLKRGPFRFEAGPVPVERTIHQPTSSLLLDLVRLQDESGRDGHEQATAPAGDDEFDFEHVAEEAPADGWLRAGAADAGPAAPAATPSTSAPSRASGQTQRPEPPPSAFRLQSLPSAAAAARADDANEAPRLDADSRPVRPGRDAAATRAPLPSNVLDLTPAGGIRHRLGRSGRRPAVVGAAATVLLLVSGYVLFTSGGGRRSSGAPAAADYETLMREAAENQSKIDSLEQLILQLSNSMTAGITTGEEAAQQISLIQSEIQRASAERDAAQFAAETKLRQEQRRDPSERKQPRNEEVRDPRGNVAQSGAPALVTASASSGRGSDATPARPAGASGARKPGEARPGQGDAQRDAEAQDSSAGVGTGAAGLEALPAAADAEGTAAAAGGAVTPESVGATTPEPEVDYSLSAIRGGPRFVPVDSRPMPRSALHPQYPRALAERKLGGTVTLWVLVDGSGRVQDVRVLRTSGHPELDRAAMTEIGRAAYTPARRDGEAVPAWTQQQVAFKLE